MTSDRRNSPLVFQRASTPRADPPSPGEQSPALAYALTVMDAYVSEQLDALVAKTAAPSSRVAQLLQTAGVEARRQDAVERLSRLTSREAEVLNGLADGKSNKLLAFEMRISSRTVEIHRSRIMKKLDCDSLFELGRLWEAALCASDSRLTISPS